MINDDETIWEKIDNWLWYNMPFYQPLYRFWDEYLRPRKVIMKVRFFWQRLTRGFDDSETWDMDSTFYKWFLPRLKRYKELSIGYPTEYNSFEDWEVELDKRIKQLESIINIDSDDFGDWSYIPEEKLKEYLEEALSKSTINSLAYDNMVNDFNKWFGDNLSKLWW